MSLFLMCLLAGAGGGHNMKEVSGRSQRVWAWADTRVICSCERMESGDLQEVLWDLARPPPVWMSFCSICFWIPQAAELCCSSELLGLFLSLSNPFFFSILLACTGFVLHTDV